MASIMKEVPEGDLFNDGKGVNSTEGNSEGHTSKQALSVVFDENNSCQDSLPPASCTEAHTHVQMTQKRLRSPGITARDTFHRILLAWTILIARGSAGHQDDNVKVSWTLQDKTDASATEPCQFSLSEADSKAGSTIAECLAIIGNLRSTASVDAFNSLVLEAGVSETSRPQKKLLVAEVDLHDDFIEVGFAYCEPEQSTRMRELLLNTFLEILDTIDAHPTLSMSSLSQSQSHELEQIWSWNQTLPMSIDRGIHEYFIENARNHPSAAAVTSHDGAFTYGELDELSNRLAYKLRDLGIKQGSAVPCCFEKSAWTVVAVLAILRTGAAFVLTDPTQPEARLRTIIEEVGAKTVLTSAKYKQLGEQVAPTAEVIVVGPSLNDEYAASHQTTLPSVLGNDLMYVIFTSGSTGKPKGVMITHSNYSSGAIPRADIVGYKSDTRVLDFASYAFDVSIDCMLLTLATRGCICVPSDEQRMNDLSGAIREMNANMVHTTPSIARVFDVDIIPSLEVLGLGGEAVPARDASVWNEQTKVVVAYGPSECTVGCAFSDDVGNGKPYTSLGKGCGGLLWIVDPDDHNRLSPVGATGELLVEGAIVGNGYLNEPEKTAAVFINDPEWLTRGHDNITGRKSQLYKTGDLVRYDPDGSGAVVFVGRKDQQVKIRGQRVELEEVEYHLRQVLPPKTVVAAEVIKPGGDGEPMLVAFVASTHQGSPESMNGVQDFDIEFQTLLVDVEQRLLKDVPKYMVPASFLSIPQIPTTVSGKTDRKQLRTIGSLRSRQELAKWRGSQATREHSRPLTERERLISELWTNILGETSEISPESSFFALGGDSLKAMKLVASARTQGLVLSIGLIFRYPTLADMASKANDKDNFAVQETAPFSLLDHDWAVEEAREQAATLCEITTSSVLDMYPCTPLQEGLMALSSKVSEAYVAQRVMRLQSRHSAQELQRAFNTAAGDCPILRTRIVHISGRGLFQVVLDECSPWQEATELQDYLLQDRASSMTLGTSLCRFGMIEDETTGQIDFVLTMHHALYDGWSMPLVVDRVNRAYHNLESVRRTPFTSFIKHFQQTQQVESESYWQSLLQGVQTQQCPALPSSDYQTKADSLLEQYISVPSNLNSNNTLATIIRAAWAVTATGYTRSPDIVFGETLTGRNAEVPGIEEIEAPLITTVPMRIQLRREMRVSEFLGQVHQQTIDRIPHEQLGLQNIRLLSRDARAACDLRTGFVLHPCADDESEKITEGPASGLVPAGDNEAAQEALKFNSYALMLVCTLEKKGFLTMASFDSKTISSDRMQEMLHRFDEVVQVLSGDGDRQLGDIFEIPERADVAGDDTVNDVHTKRDLAATKENNPKAFVETAQDSLSPEQCLARLWARILKVDEDEITPSDNFFDLGGDSIGAMKLVSELKGQQYNTTVAQIFANRRLDKLAKLLEKTELKQDEQIAVNRNVNSSGIGDTEEFIKTKITPELVDSNWTVQTIYPARPLQEIAVKGTTDLPRYSVRYEQFFFNDQVDKQKLFDSCQKLISLNEILRTIFVSVEGKCYAVVIESIETSLAEYVIEGDVESFSQSLCDVDVQSKMPEGSSFVKFFYVENREGQSSLIFRLSHSQYDEICLPNMLRQLSSLYQGDTPEKSVPFSDFVQHLATDNIPKSEQYWRQHLQNSKLSVLPGPKDVVPDRKKWASMTKTVNTAGRTKDITLATFPTAAWALTLARRLSSNDMVFGEVASGRNTGFANADSVIGPCWQYIPFRLKLDKSWTRRDLLQAVQDQHISSSQFEGMGLSEIITKCTDWPEDTVWFDSVVHQDVVHVESLPFSVANSRMKTYYPHLEPLREWKVQAFAGKNEMMLEVVTFEAWRELGAELLDDLVSTFEELINDPDGLVFTEGQ